MKYAVTDAVFVRTDSLANLGFDQVSGIVVLASKKAGDPVSEGEIIGKIDDASYRFKVERMAAEIESTRNSLAEKKLLLQRLKIELDLNARISRYQVTELEKKHAATIAEAKAVQVVIEQLERDRKRYDTLYKSEAVSRSRSEDIATDLSRKQAEKDAIEKKAAAVEVSIKTARLDVRLSETKQTRLAEIEEQINALTEKIRGMEAALKNAEKNLDDCTLKSTISGVIAKQYVTAGDHVSPASPVYAVMNPKDLYIVALLEENKLKGVFPGNPVTISIDAYPNQTYKGVVDHVLPASAATFALAPRDISAGEFTKVAQRIPIRIRITKGNMDLLRVGLSGKVEILRKEE